MSTSRPEVSAGVPPASWAAPLAGLLGGALAGGADSADTLARGIGGLTAAKAAWLPLLGMAVGAVAGLIVASAVVALGAWLRGLRPSAGVWVGAWAAALLAAPVVVYDAFALFEGAQASRVPGHGGISVLLAVGGVAGVAGLARVYLWLLERPHAVRSAALLAVAAAGFYWADRELFPRLYPWFHATLSLAFLVSCVLLARLGLTMVTGGAAASRLRRGTLGMSAAAAALLVVTWPALLRSQGLRYTAYERTRIVGLLLRQLPLPSVAATSIRRERVARLSQEEAPLPEGPHLPDADVVLITVDALRADHVGAYGYHRPTTPHIDALARRGVRFDRAYAQAPHTSFSIASLHTGKYYPTIARLAPEQPHDTVAHLLRRYGWKTAAFYPPAVFYVDAHKLKAYQANNFGFEYVKLEYLDAFKRLDQIEAFLRLDKPRKAFLWIHLFEPHEPYEAREGFSFGKSEVDRYDSEVAYADAAVGKIVAYLEKHRPGAIVMVTADHGEEFDDHGGRYHGSTLYDEQVRVPLIIAAPGVAPRVVAAPVELIDISPTILGLLDIPVPARMRGTDLGPWLANPPAPESRLPPAFAEVEDRRMVVWGSEKLICVLNWGYCAYHDLATDPKELRNQAEERPDRVKALRERLDVWLDDHARYEPRLARGLANPRGEMVPKAIERGRLGDMSVAPDLAALLGTTAGDPVKREAARLLVSLPPRKDTAQALVEALGATDPEIGDWAAVAATRLGDARGKEHARRIVTRPREAPARPEDVTAQAALALASGGDPTGVPALIEALDFCHDAVMFCRQIILTVGKLVDERVVPKLIEHLSEVQNRRERVLALGLIGDQRAVAPLRERLIRDEYVNVRAEAARSLGRIGGPEAREGIERAAGREEDPSVRAAIEEARRALAASEAITVKAPPSRTKSSRDTARSLPPASAQ